jgi:holo-[acyl-carrier protein] synthase
VILGIGTDLCEVSRIERALERFGERFAARILVASELEVFRRRRARAGYLAKRFAAKEAFSKALGVGIRYPVNWHNVWVVNERSGKPAFEFSRPLAALLRRRGVAKVHLSLTDEIGMACAFVVVEGPAPKRRAKR